jgi:hypothetical protein
MKKRFNQQERKLNAALCKPKKLQPFVEKASIIDGKNVNEFFVRGSMAG